MNLLLVFLLLFNLIPLAKTKNSVWQGFRGAGDSHTESNFTTPKSVLPANKRRGSSHT
jgi:hypothetical protein